MPFGTGTFNAAGGAVDDFFAAAGLKSQAKGLRIEQGMLTKAAGFADTNADFTKESTGIQSMQQQRKTYLGLGTLEADVGGAGFQMSGSALDLMRSSAEQGALEQAVMEKQGLITEQGYEVQADANRSQADAAGIAAKAADKAAMGKQISSGIKAATAIASIFV